MATIGDTEMTASASTSNNLQVNTLVSIPEQASIQNDHSAEYFAKGLSLGSRWSFSLVIRHNVSQFISKAKGIIASLDEEQHATRYRKSKLTALTQFCEALQAGAEEPWFGQACQTYHGCFDEKRSVFVSAYEKTEAQRQELKLASDDYTAKQKAAEIDEHQAKLFEAKFRLIYDCIVEILTEFTKELNELNARCASENSLSAASQQLVEEKQNIEQRTER